VLALLALACFPVLAHADSSGIQYEPVSPTVTGHNQSIPEGKKSNGGATASSTGGSEGSESESSTGGASGDSPTTGNGGGSGQGSPANGQDTGGTPAAGGGQSQNPAPVSNSTSPDSGGGSSPLVPILIALAALAVVSIGAVVIRQRRQGSGSSFSPKAG
jgi:cobalamin biosynthesis Mg chelatase CobN